MERKIRHRIVATKDEKKDKSFLRRLTADGANAKNAESKELLGTYSLPYV